MIYFKDTGDTIEKIKVTCDKEKLKEIREILVNRCSIAIHRETETDYSPKFDNPKLIRNMHYSYVGEKEYFEETRDIFHYSYDELIPPYLVTIIDKLLADDPLAVEYLLNYTPSSNTTLEEKINTLTQELVNAPNIQRKKQILADLNNLIKLHELNKTRENPDNYFEDIINSLTFYLLDTISTKDIERVESFLDMELLSTKSKKRTPHNK